MSVNESLDKKPEDAAAGQTAPASIEGSAEERPEPIYPFPIAGVGSSAGGLEALTQLFANLPGDMRMAFIVVQHLDPRHASMAPEILARVCKMPVVEATDGVAMKPGQVFVMPSGSDIRLDHGRLRLMPRAVGGAHLPIDRFFRSLAAEQKSGAIGVVLSGTGSDGALGLEAINAEGGVTFAQTPDSAKHDGMPKAAIAMGAVDFVLPPSQIAEELGRFIQNGAAVKLSREREPLDDPSGEESLTRIFGLLRDVTGTDFSQYRRASIMRRMGRRMALFPTKSLLEYVAILESTPAEIRTLQQDLLIGVTRFFRDPQVFDFLKEAVFPRIFRNRPDSTTIRVWVPGCSQGHEAYSVAICLLESMALERVSFPVQIFGTDVSDDAVSKARTGRYIENIELDVSPERLRHYFVKAGGYYQVGNKIRELCTFARHDVVKDPPFPNLDLISCRNLLIYLEAALQYKIIPLFRYALKRNGVLVLGKSETVGSYTDLFESLDKTHKIYCAAGNLDVGRYLAMSGVHRRKPDTPPNPPDSAAALASPLDLQRHIERILVSEYAPAGVLVNQSLDVVQYRGDTTPYLMPASGRASQSLARMAREGLLPALRGAIREAQASRRPARREGLRVRSQQGLREFALRVFPIKIDASEEGLLILFEEPRPDDLPRSLRQADVPPPSAKASAGELRRELESTKEFLGRVIEDREAAHEELQTSNEELLSSNEELQSLNEELESAREELQSANEELSTINQELQNRNSELSSTNSDLQNVLVCANVPMLIFGPDLSVRRATGQAGRLFGISAADLGKPLARLDARLNIHGIEQLLLGVIESLVPQDVETQDANGRWQKVAIRPYRTEEKRLDGAVVTFTDIDLLKRSEMRYQQLFDRTFQAPHDGMVLVDVSSGTILKINQRLMEMLGVTAGELQEHEIWTIPVLRPLVASDLDLKRYSETPYWHYETRWLVTKSGTRLNVDVISIVHVLRDRDTVQFALREVAGPKSPSEVLTKREVQVLTLLAAGNSTKQAAASLGIAFKTAVGHRSAIMRKLGIHDTASLVRYAIRAGLVQA